MNENKDTVGYHLRHALMRAKVAELYARRALALYTATVRGATTADNTDLMEPYMRIAAVHDGAAAGHAFRAAELAQEVR